jgi:erythromycin esterase-like protein
VAKDAKNINFGAILPGTGTAWFDDLAVEVDGQPYGDSSLFDFGFESPSPRGFFVGGPGYRVELDDRVVRTGSQSLRMTRVAPVSDRSTTHNRSLSRWQEIVGHLEAGRDRYRTAGAESRDIEWAIQNARLVVQRAQMFLNLVGRDRSMADNVKWIADQNPRAKIVLWAHNGHVAMGGGFAGESMGAALQRMFGGEVFVFGFAFGSGSFQAVPTGQGVPRPMTVPPAPEGSLDRTLSAADIPLFALDLRRAHAWFGAPRASRQIGAVYPEGEPYALMPQFVAPEAFHAILFTDKTTTAIKNPGR